YHSRGLSLRLGDRVDHNPVQVRRRISSGHEAQAKRGIPCDNPQVVGGGSQELQEPLIVLDESVDAHEVIPQVRVTQKEGRGDARAQIVIVLRLVAPEQDLPRVTWRGRSQK